MFMELGIIKRHVSRYCSKLLTLEYNNCRGRFEIRPFPRRTLERCGRKQTASATNQQCLDCCDAHSNSEMGQNSGNQFSLAYRRLLTLLPQALEYILVKSRAKPKL